MKRFLYPSSGHYDLITSMTRELSYEKYSRQEEEKEKVYSDNEATLFRAQANSSQITIMKRAIGAK